MEKNLFKKLETIQIKSIFGGHSEGGNTTNSPDPSSMNNPAAVIILSTGDLKVTVIIGTPVPA